MKREADLVRAILLEVENSPPGTPLKIEGYNEDIVAEHVRLLKEAGYIEAKISVAFNKGVPQVRSYSITRLLNDGHDFIANAKNPTVWAKTKDFLKEKGIDVPLAVLKGVLVKKATEYLGLS